jgi:hypothetical protein
MLYDLVHASESEEKKAVYKGVLSGTYKAPHLKLLKPTRRVHDTLNTVGLDMYIDIFGDEQQALAPLANINSTAYNLPSGFPLS